MKIRAAHYRTGRVAEFTFEKGRLTLAVPVRGKSDLLYGPGFFDIQCNGFAGIDFNHPEPTAEGLRAAVHALWRYGVTHVMPTIMSGPPERMAVGMRMVAATVARFPEVRGCIPAIHQEGPYFSEAEGARGAHPPQEIIAPRLGHFDRLQRAARGMIRMVTLAPERENALSFIRTLVRRGIVAAIGHTSATPAQITQAVHAGAGISTHLGNGSAQMLPRHHNYILAQLGEDRLYASFIPDGHHLPPWVLKSFLRAKTFGKSVLTTDCIAAAGAPPGRYTIGWLVVEVGRDRIARQPGQPNFAGSALTMDEAVANAVRFADVPLATAWEMSSLNPWNVMRRAALLRQPRLADTFIIAHFQRNRFAVQATVIGRRLACQA